MGLKLAVGIPLGDWRLEDDVDGNGLSDGWIEYSSPGDLVPSMLSGHTTADDRAYPFGSGTTQQIVLPVGGTNNLNYGRYLMSGKSPSGYLNSGLNLTTAYFVVFATYAWDPATAGDAWSLIFGLYKSTGVALTTLVSRSYNTDTGGAFVTESSATSYTFSSGNTDPDYVKAQISVPQQRTTGDAVLKVARIGLGLVLLGGSSVDELSTPHNHAGTRSLRSGFGSRTSVPSSGRSFSFDPAAGKKRTAYEFAYRNLPLADVRRIRSFWGVNKGTTPIAAAGAAYSAYQRGSRYPLIIQPGLEEMPGFAYVDFADEDFPLSPDNTWSSSVYQGTLGFEEV